MITSFDKITGFLYHSFTIIMARIVKQENSDSYIVSLRTEGAVIIPKAIRKNLDLRAGDLFEIEVQGSDLVFHHRPIRPLKLKGVPAASLDKLTGLIRLGGDAVRNKKHLYER